MEEGFSKVSLGFAEFVSQLLHEMFDASISAQGYQLEKYYELEKAANLSTEQFNELYISENELLEKEVDLLGFVLKKKMVLTEENLDRLSYIEENLESFIKRSKIIVQLKNVGFEFFKSRIMEILVDERKNNLRELLNRNEMARLMIDSGEIKAKLELTNIYENNAKEIETKDAKKLRLKLEKRILKGKAKPIISEPLITAELDQSKDFELDDIRYKEILDPVTGKKTLIIDKSGVLKNPEVTTRIPGVRVATTPASDSLKSHLNGEITIKFKTV